MYPCVSPLTYKAGALMNECITHKKLIFILHWSNQHVNVLQMNHISSICHIMTYEPLPLYTVIMYNLTKGNKSALNAQQPFPLLLLFNSTKRDRSF